MKSLQQIVEGLLDANYGKDDTTLVYHVIQDTLGLEENDLSRISVYRRMVTIDVPPTKKYIDIPSFDKLIHLGIRSFIFTNSKNCKILCGDSELKDIIIRTEGLLHFYNTDANHKLSNVNIQCEHLAHGATYRPVTVTYSKCTVDCEALTGVGLSKLSTASSKMNVNQLFLLHSDKSFTKRGQSLGIACFGTGNRKRWDELRETTNNTFDGNTDVMRVLGLSEKSLPILKKIVISSQEDGGYGISLYKMSGREIPHCLGGNYKIEFNNDWRLQTVYDANAENKYSVSSQL